MVTKWRAISISLHLTASLFAFSLPEKGGNFLEVTGWQMVAQPWRNLCGGTCAYFLGCVLASHSLLPAPHALLVFLKKSPKQEAHSAIHGAANGGLCGEIHVGSRSRQLAT